MKQAAAEAEGAPPPPLLSDGVASSRLLLVLPPETDSLRCCSACETCVEWRRARCFTRRCKLAGERQRRWRQALVAVPLPSGSAHLGGLCEHAHIVAIALLWPSCDRFLKGLVQNLAPQRFKGRSGLAVHACHVRSSAGERNKTVEP